MHTASFNEFLSERQILEDFLNKLEIQLNTCLEDFEVVNVEKLKELNDSIKDNAPYAAVIGKEFYKDFIKFQNEFDYFTSSFNELKRFKMEVTLEDFLDTIQLLRKDIYQITK